MATDRLWVELRARVGDALFADRDVVNHPPQSSQDWEYLADTVTDHIYAVARGARHHDDR